MQRKIDRLKKKLCHALWKRTPSNFDVSTDDEEDVSYKTPPSESFSYNKEHRHEYRYKCPPHKGLGNDAMSNVLNQISKSPFTHKIEGARLPQRLNQPTFTIYNSRTDPVEHVSLSIPKMKS